MLNLTEFDDSFNKNAIIASNYNSLIVALGIIDIANKLGLSCAKLRSSWG
jgi:hypothetical protein